MKTIIANWKMNVGTRESVALARGVLLALRGKKVLPEIVACAPFVALSEMRKVVARTHVALGAQDVFWEDSGAFTGEISARMLAELGVTHVIIGHSERRAMGESDDMINKKVIAALAQGLTPILCVGESKAQRDAGETGDVIANQLRGALHGLHTRHKDKLLVAYEPVWAIGTGDAAQPAGVVQVHAQIRSLVSELLPGIKPMQYAVLYGGSVDAQNAYGFLREPEINGLLVGGASVNLSEFSKVLAAAMDAIEGQLSA
jgi:triosephosphate isomerase